MKPVWIALLAVGVSLFGVFIAFYAAHVKKTREGGHGGTTSADTSTTDNDCGGGCD
jgi:hypothetical protein